MVKNAQYTGVGKNDIKYSSSIEFQVLDGSNNYESLMGVLYDDPGCEIKCSVPSSPYYRIQERPK